MKSEPNIGRAAIASTLYSEYGVDVERVSFWPVGEASYGYVVDLAGGKRYFIKLLNAALSTHQPALRHLGSFVPLAAALAEASLPVSRPVLTRSGRPHATLGQYSLLAFEYVSGNTLGEKPWPVACYADLGATVGRLHSLTDDLTALTPDRDVLAVPTKADLRTLLQDLEGIGDQDGPARQALHDAVCPHRDAVLGHHDDMSVLLQAARARGPSWVLCHTDLTGGNLISVPGGPVHVIDWEGAGLAPREFDLAFFVDDPYSERFGSFLSAYQTVAHIEDLDANAFAFRMYHRNFEDFCEGCRFVLDEDVSEEELAHAVQVVVDDCVEDWPNFHRGREKVERHLQAWRHAGGH